MKKFRLLLFAFVVSMLFAIPAFADVDNLYPLNIKYGAGNVMFGEWVEIDEDDVVPVYKNGAVIKEVNVIGVKGLKTSLLVCPENGAQVAWNKSGTIESGYSDDWGAYSKISFNPSKNAVYYATVSDGADKIKIKFNIVSIIPVNVNHIAPTYIGQLLDDEVYPELKETFNNFEDKPLYDKWDMDEKSYLFKSQEDVMHDYDGTIDPDYVVHAEAGQNTHLFVSSVDGVKFSWNTSGKVISKNGISIIRFKPTKSGMVYCTISCGSTKVKVPFKVEVNNHLRVTDTEMYTECCKGNKVKVVYEVSGNDIKKLTVKAKSLRGKGFSCKYGRIDENIDKTQEREIFITYTPTSNGTSYFVLTDKFGSSITLESEVDLIDHDLPELGDGEIKKQPTAIATGTEVAYCDNCNMKVTRTLPKLPATIKVPATFKVKIGKKEPVNVTLTKGDYITSVSATKNGKTVIIKVFKKANCFWVQGINAGTSEVTVKTKAGKTAKCKVTAYK